MASNNSNYNKISVKTDSIVEMIEQLAKLGVFKEKRKPRAKKASPMPADIRQDNDMGPSFTTTQIIPGMTNDQIEDIQRRNNANIAALKAEVEQQRLEDFQEITEPTSSITNIRRERFRGDAPPIDNPFVQSTTIEEIPDVEEREMSQTLNEGAPEYVPRPQIKAFAGDDEDEGFGLPGGYFLEGSGEAPLGGGAPPSLQPIGRIRSSRASGVVKKRDAVAKQLNLGLVPAINQTSPAEMKAYYLALINAAGDEPKVFKSKGAYFKAINDYLDEEVLLAETGLD